LKFKFIFIFLNITLLIFLAIIIVMPLLMLGTAMSASFWRTNWPLILVLIVLLVAFNLFYFINRRLFLLLEKEDWPALVRYLEDKVIQKGRYSSRMVRLLANCYLVLSDSAAVMSLENKTAIAKPALVDANALVFGTARILGKDIFGAIRFFDAHKATVKTGIRDWVRWYHGFTLFLDRQNEAAGEEFCLLARTSKDAVITGLSSYFLSETFARFTGEKTPEYREASLLGRERVLKTLPSQKNWSREISRLSTEIHAAAIFKHMEDTGRWLYNEAGKP